MWMKGTPMYYKTYYESPLGKILLVSSKTHLIGLWLEGQKYSLDVLNKEPIISEENEVLIKAKQWLDDYFHFKKPNVAKLPLAPMGNDFRQKVWRILCEIPYGEVTTYKNIAEKIAKQTNKKSMSAQAIGNAVGHNPISIIIPCHRVVGTNGSLTGYAGGIDKKIFLLELEKVDRKQLFVPKKSTAM